jgi:hypothetical protein
MTAPAENTPNAIIWDALLESGKLADGDIPDSEVLAKYSRRLRDMINAWQTSGLKLFLQLDQSITLVAGQTTYTAKPGGDINIVKPLRVQQGYYLNTTNAANPVRQPMFPLSWQEWLTLSTTQTQGPVSQYFVDKQPTQLNISFWLTPDATTAANGTAHLLIQQQVTSFTNLTDTMNFPVEWRLALVWGLADELTTGQPPEVVMRCAQKAMKYKTDLENWDVEDADTRFQPDMRQGNTGMQRFI